MSKAESRDGLEYPVSNLEVFGTAISSAAEVLVDRMGQLATEGVSVQDLVWIDRLRKATQGILGPLERLCAAINDAPYEATVTEEELTVDESSANEHLQADVSRIASGEPAVKSERAKSAPGALSEREQQIWQRITSGGSTTEWFGQKDLDMESIGFSSPSAKNQAFSQFCKKAIAAGLLVDNGKDRGGRRYKIAPDAPSSILSWDLSETVDLTGEGSDSQAVEAITPEDTSTAPTEPDQELQKDGQEIYDPSVEVTIRGQVFSFTTLEYKIIKALLEGKGGNKEIIAYINGHEGLEEADPDFYKNEFQPALKRLESLTIGSTPLVKAHFIDGPNGKYMRLKLPDGARIESKKGVETLRFTDSSTTAGIPHSRSGRRGAHDTKEPVDEIVVEAPVPTATKPSSPVIPKATKPRLPEVVSSIRLSETGLVDADGKDIALEPQRKAVLNALRSGSRLTVADIAKQINPEAGNDATFKSIVADELAEIQKLLGAAKLRRKQKPGTPAKWWLED